MRKLLSVSAMFIVLILSGNAQDTVLVSAGWNIIGSLGTGTVPEMLVTVPPGIITTAFYGYLPGEGYRSTVTLGKGSGYWVKVSADGMLIFQASPAGQCGVKRVDYGGVSYGTVQIGNQCWLKENLDVGEMIPGADTASDNGVIEKYCFNNDTVNCAGYGGLYRWDEAMQYSLMPGSGGICPPGWHIPTVAEFDTLKSVVGGDGNALKAIGQGSGGAAGTNTSGFSALLAGQKYIDGTFYDLGDDAYLWSSTEYDPGYASFLSLYGSYSDVHIGANDKAFGFGVRCLKD